MTFIGSPSGQGCNSQNSRNLKYTIPITHRERKFDANVKLPVPNFALDDKNADFFKYSTYSLNDILSDYNSSQLSRLSSALTDKEHLNAFLKIASNDNLNSEDIYNAFIYLDKECKIDGIKDWFKNAWEICTTRKSRLENKAEKLASNMNDIRTVRGDEFSTDTVLSLGSNMMTNDDIYDCILHLVSALGNDDKFLYSENNVLDANNFMSENPDDVNSFMTNIFDMESIKDENGRFKYSGDTNIYLAQTITQNDEIGYVLKNAAHKSDMNNEYLVHITDNLIKTPDMALPIEYSLLAKNPDGSDKFSAKAISNETDILLGKSKAYCASYTKNLCMLSNYQNLKGDDVLTIANNITEYPQITNDIVSKIESNTLSSQDIASYSNSFVASITSGYVHISRNTNTIEPSSDLSALVRKYSVGGRSVDVNDLNFMFKKDETKSFKLNDVRNLTEKTSLESVKDDNCSQGFLPASFDIEQEPINESNEKPIVSDLPADKKPDTNKQIKSKVVLKENSGYKRFLSPVDFGPESFAIEHAELKDVLERKFGSYSEEIYEAIQKNPSALSLIMQYEYNPLIVRAFVKTPELVEKINAVSSVISNSELSDLIGLCDSSKSLELILKSLENGCAANAIKITQKSKINNVEDDVLEILNSKTINSLMKKKKIEDLLGIQSDAKINNNSSETLCNN